MSGKMLRKSKRNQSKVNHLRPLASLLATGLSLPALAQSVPFPTYTTGAQPDGSFVVSSGQIITPAGKQVDLGVRVRAKAVALNPNVKTHTAAVLTMGATQVVEVFDTQTGEVLQNYITFGQDSQGSYSGIAYTPDGKHLIFSQDSSNVTIANVSRRWPADRRFAQVKRSAEQLPSSNAFPTARRPLTPIPAARFGHSAATCVPRRPRDLPGWQERLCPAEPERHAGQDRSHRDARPSQG